MLPEEANVAVRHPVRIGRRRRHRGDRGLALRGHAPEVLGELVSTVVLFPDRRHDSEPLWSPALRRIEQLAELMEMLACILSTQGRPALSEGTR